MHYVAEGCQTHPSMNLVLLGSIQSICKVLEIEINFGVPPSLSTYLVESIHLQSKSVDSGHAAH